MLRDTDKFVYIQTSRAESERHPAKRQPALFAEKATSLLPNFKRPIAKSVYVLNMMQGEAAAHLTSVRVCVAILSTITAPHAAALPLMWLRPAPDLAQQACCHGATSLYGFSIEPIEADFHILRAAKAASDSDAATGLGCHAAGCNVFAHMQRAATGMATGSCAPKASIMRRASCYCVLSQDRLRRSSQEVQADQIRCTFDLQVQDKHDMTKHAGNVAHTTAFAQ